MDFLSKFIKGTVFSEDISEADEAIIRDQIMRDNRRFVIIWACAESAYWILDLILSMYKHDFIFHQSDCLSDTL